MSSAVPHPACIDYQATLEAAMPGVTVEACKFDIDRRIGTATIRLTLRAPEPALVAAGVVPAGFFRGMRPFAECRKDGLGIQRRKFWTRIRVGLLDRLCADDSAAVDRLESVVLTALRGTWWPKLPT